MKRIAAALALASCSAQQCYPETEFPNYTAYPQGGETSSSDAEILARVSECLSPLRTKWLTPAESDEALCYGSPTLEVRSCVHVSVAPDWYVSQYSGEEIFPCDVPGASCAAKGQPLDAGFACSCRAMIQDNTTIWVTPNRKLLPAYAVTLLTGCMNPWTVPSLVKCASPEMVVAP